MTGGEESREKGEEGGRRRKGFDSQFCLATASRRAEQRHTVRLHLCVVEDESRGHQILMTERKDAKSDAVPQVLFFLNLNGLIMTLPTRALLPSHCEHSVRRRG